MPIEKMQILSKPFAGDAEMKKEISTPKGYTSEFKVLVFETMHREGLSYCEAARHFVDG